MIADTSHGQRFKEKHPSKDRSSPMYDKPCRIGKLYDNVIFGVYRQVEIDRSNDSFSIVIGVS